VGPGFDTLALALDRYVLVDVEPASKLIVRSVGRARAWRTTRPPGRPGGHRRRRHRPPRHHRPVGHPYRPGPRLLGRLAVAAAAAAGAADPLSVATAMDGHPDNAAASMVGGFVAAAVVKGGSTWCGFPSTSAWRSW